MNATANCPQCGRTLPADAPSGVCPQCLLGIGMRTDSRADTLERPGSFTPPKPHQLAQHFPQLEILDLIGHGGMGAVYKARQRGLDRLVALKILPPEVGQDPSFAERFAREARALARLSHSNIVGVHDSGNAGGFYYLLMEYVDGVNLREAIQTNELTPAEALAIVPQICEALQFAHDEGIVHRDIKPENILLDTKGRVKIADFGLARLLGQAPDDFTLTGTHQVMGTPKYMAPEQMEGSHEVDHRADIYSLGVVFYEMLTGELPLGRFDAPSHKVQLDVRIDEVVLRTLQKEPSRRYQQASELKTDVESISEFANTPPHLRRMRGYEYRSKTEVFGWPLIHIASGIDPKTGRTRVAKGIIAIGNVAVGGFAMGGVACGVLAFGGAAVGLITFGGAALGLLVAIGGAAVGVGFSFGGIAIGSVAVGGMAIGYYAFGDETLAVYGINSTITDEEAQRFFHHGAFPLVAAFPILATIGTFALIFSMVIIAAIAKRNSDETGVRREKPSERRRMGCGGCAIAVLLLYALMLVVPCIAGFAVAIYEHLSGANEARQLANLRAVEAARLDTERERDIREQIAAGRWKLTDDGPALTPMGESAFSLNPNQVPQVDQILQSVFRDYLEIEREHVQQHIHQSGRYRTSLDKFTSAEREALEQSLWGQLDEVLTVEQQQRMRDNLRVHVGDGASEFDGDRWKPGILGWSVTSLEIEFWKVGTWYHWNLHTEVPLIGSHRITGSAPQLPNEFKRFWNEELYAESLAHDDPSIDSPPEKPQE